LALGSDHRANGCGKNPLAGAGVACYQKALGGRCTQLVDGKKSRLLEVKGGEQGLWGKYRGGAPKTWTFFAVRDKSGFIERSLKLIINVRCL